ncbi:hypothetical protein [Pseudomonas gingeri]|uniref:hypothetical protein n=1 Tax=Pseudomonas gingeri TaxID=117681 RepID=UPI0015A0A125|nr:hypothetical protein [Pseudomonas gingeri]NWD08495.1 hypothetical protein [Pseudomonas gingeri]NWE36675.1 hypothetical protein [Pseudomonas gingeri]NWE60624.1 hypothetical protein [Pseudomonas gingeri]NWF04759.1 hypothetical protein [Pseudomonas gingeri]
MRLDVSEGAYSPSYFYMHIHTKDALEKDLLSHSQTFLHEYIHFLQDLFLAYNIRLNIGQLRRFALVASKANETGFVQPFNQWDEDSEIVHKQFEHSWGGTKFIDEEDATVVGLTNTHFIVPNTTIRVFEYKAELSTGEQYSIGARDMLEYIAHKIEANHWITAEPAFPYRSMDKVFEHLGLSQMPGDCRIALVEFCLHNDNPFHHMLKVIEFSFGGGNQKLLFDSATIDSTLKAARWNSAGGFNETIKSKVKRRLGMLSDELKKRFHSDNFSSISSWVDDVLKIVESDFCGELFFTRLYRMDSSSFFSMMTSLVETIGMPIIFNDNDEMISLLPEKYDCDQFIQFYAAQKFLHFVAHKGKTCPLIAVCEANNEEIVNDDCYRNAIVRGLDEKLCPFGQLVHTYNLHNIK